MARTLRSRSPDPGWTCRALEATKDPGARWRRLASPVSQTLAVLDDALIEAVR